jgi:hypothetical protein
MAIVVRQHGILFDTAGLGPEATEFANKFARQIGSLSEGDVRALLSLLNERLALAAKRPRS